MKTIFLAIGESSVARNLLRTDFWAKLSAEPMRFVLLVNKDEEAYYKEKFGKENVLIEGLAPRRMGLFEKILAFLAMHAFLSGTKEVMEQRRYAEVKNGIPPFFKQALGSTFRYNRLFQHIVRALELRIPPSPDLAATFERHDPCLVFSTVIVNPDIDIPVAREAKRRHVRLIAMTRSWDNLTTYGFLRVVPDLFIAQSRFLKEMAVCRHGLREDHVVISGIPHYDQYADTRWIDDRSGFLRKLNMDPSKGYVLYGAVGDFLFPTEGKLANAFERIGKELDMQFVFRAHPAFKSPLEKLTGLTHVFPDRNAAYRAAEEGSYQMEDANIRHLINSLYHADVVLTSGSSFLVDAAAFDKPTVTIAFDGEKTGYWGSVARFYDRFDHIVDLLRLHGVRVAHTEEELKASIREYIEDPRKDAAGRRAIVERFIAPLGGSSQRLYDIVRAEIDAQTTYER